MDDFAPSILFSCPPWRTSDNSERFLKIEGNPTDVQLNIAVRIVFGLWSNGPTLAQIRNEMESDYANSVDPEDYRSYMITDKMAFHRASKKILQEFRTYFHAIRESVDLIKSEINSFLKEGVLKNEQFLRLFILKAIPKFAPECELWDFKETIDAWHNTSVEKLKADFGYNVASYANNKGGLIIIGITTKIARF